MKRRLLVFSTLFTLASGALYAQQDKVITHFIFDKMSFNPAATGINQGICGTTVYRNQWDKVNGAPNSALLNVEANLLPVIKQDLGVGISFYHDAIGFTRMNHVKLNASYRFNIAGAGRLGVGVGLGLFNIGMSPVWVPPVTQIDPSLPQGFSDNKFDLNGGLYWVGLQDYYVGISSTHLTAPRLSDETGLPVGGSTTPSTVTYDAARHYYLMGGKKFVNLIGNGVHLDANALLRTDLVKYSADINARVMYKDLAYGGLTYRTSDAIAIMVGARPFKLSSFGPPMDNLLVGYSYDITINKLAGISRGTHEVMLKYCYYLPPVPIQKSKHPRWL